MAVDTIPLLAEDDEDVVEYAAADDADNDLGAAVVAVCVLSATGGSPSRTLRLANSLSDLHFRSL
jgi:hypothetical protein